VSTVESTQAEYRARLPNHEGLWEGEWYVWWGRGRIDAADSVARTAFATTSQSGERALAANFLGGTAYLRGKLRDGIRWRTESNLAVHRATRAPDRLLLAALDSAQHAGFFLQEPQQARAIIRRALVRTPIAQMPPASRPWNYLGEVAAVIRAAPLAREALEGFESDLPQLGSVTPEGERARMRSWVAMASGQYSAAIKEMREADRAFALNERRALIAIAEAFDLNGERDSAIVYYEKFVRTPDEFPMRNGVYLAGTHKRLGELYDARADSGRAEAHYQFFVDMWKDADAELQPKVREVRARLAQLRRQRG
ncbi:MAG: tetratricopeptide repeat protein, partial [Gemmatimonadaceae bacterium]